MPKPMKINLIHNSLFFIVIFLSSYQEYFASDIYLNHLNAKKFRSFDLTFNPILQILNYFSRRYHI